MTGNRIVDIVKGGCDSTDAEIVCVYAKVAETYAVYRTFERVMFQFADDSRLGADQRKAMAPLNPLRGQINGLIDGWRAPDHHENVKAKAAMFDRRVADALVLGLQSEVPQAEALLAEIKEDLLEERTSPARVDYFFVTAAAALLVILVSCIMTSNPYRAWYSYSPHGWDLWLGAGAGALGALFSTGIAMRTRTILTDLQPMENRTDAIARIMIGAIAGTVLVALLDAGHVSLSVGGSVLSTQESRAWTGLAAAAFVAGFLERLVPDMLTASTLAARARSGGNPLAGSQSASSATWHSGVASGSERNPLGRTDGGRTQGQPAAAPPTAEEAEANALDVSPAANDVAGDTRLPAAAGGEEAPRPNLGG